jgi:hypothetical protein
VKLFAQHIGPRVKIKVSGGHIDPGRTGGLYRRRRQPGHEDSGVEAGAAFGISF